MYTEESGEMKEEILITAPYSNMTFTPPDTTEFDKRLKSVAEKLGVKSIDANSPFMFRMILVTSDGAKYDVMEMMEKFLTKMDEKL